MSRKFWTSYNALIANYSANQNVNQFTYGAGTWTESTLINAPPYGGNLISMSIGAATIGNARCLKTAYDSGAVVPFTCTNGVWSVGSPITSPAGGNPASVAISFDGMHALAGGDWMSGVGALSQQHNVSGHFSVPGGGSICMTSFMTGPLAVNSLLLYSYMVVYGSIS